jgi:hypothetical protein
MSNRLRGPLGIVACTAALVFVLAACGSSGGSKSGGSKETSTTTKAKTSSSGGSALPGCKAGAPDPGTKASKQKMSVDPCEGLTAGQTVKVYASGFTPGKTVGINQCSTKTDDTGSGCDLEHLKTFTIGPDGTGSGDYPVAKGPFGKDNVVCTPPTQCLLSVGELAAGDVERADPVNINFAG